MNPFKTIFPENMDDDLVRSLFVEEYTNISNVLDENHHIVWGSRGSGKSMLFRYIFSKNPQKYSELNTIYDSDNRLIIYFKLKQGMLNTVDFLFLDENEAVSISEHMLNMYITQSVIKTLDKIENIDITVLNTIAESIADSIFDNKIISSINYANEKLERAEFPLRWLHYMTTREIDKAQYYLRRYRKEKCSYEAAFTGYHDYLYKLFQVLQENLHTQKLKFFLLIDDAGRLFPFQQKIINNWIANRDHDIFSLKLSATKNDYTCFYTQDNIAIDPTHDYAETELDVIYYRKTAYMKRINDIVKKRFSAYNLALISPDALYPTDRAQNDIIKAMEIVLRDKYSQSQKNVTWAVYKSRHLMPLVFQELRKNNKSFSYSGFSTLVDLSSGIVRNFIEMSNKMFKEVEKSLPEGTVVTSIPPITQNEVANKFASDFLNKISSLYKNSTEDINYLNTDSSENNFDVVFRTETLLKSLGDYFRDRLLNPDLAEQIMFSFSIKDYHNLNDNIRLVLNLASKHSYLQKSTYSSKNSRIREDWYLLSRCLAPLYNLYAGALKGRIILSSEDLEIAIRSSEEFMNKKKAVSRKQNRFDQNQMSLHEAIQEDIIIFDDDEEGDSNEL